MVGLKQPCIMIRRNAKTVIALPFHAKIITKMEARWPSIIFAKLDLDRAFKGIHGPYISI